MAKHPTSSRVHRDDEHSDDAFIKAVKSVAAWAVSHARAITYFGTGIAIIAAVSIYWFASQRKIEATAAAQLSQVQQSVASGNSQLAIRDLRTYLDTYGGTRAAREARLVLADLLISQDSAQQAIATIGNLSNNLEDPLGIAAARLKAAAFENLGQADDAVDEYVRIADKARFKFQRREALADAARVRMQTGNPQAAVRFYQQLLETFGPNEPGRQYYAMWLAEARAQARGTTPAPAAADTGAGRDTSGS